MHIGRKRLQVVFERVTEVQSISGAMVRAWGTLATVWASIEPLRGQEALQAQAMNAVMSHKIRTRWNSTMSGVTPKDRVKYGSRYFDIVEVRNLNERNRELEIMAVERIGAP